MLDTTKILSDIDTEISRLQALRLAVLSTAGLKTSTRSLSPLGRRAIQLSNQRKTVRYREDKKFAKTIDAELKAAMAERANQKTMAVVGGGR